MPITSTDIEIRYEIDKIMLDVDRAIPCALIINEAVSNVLLHAFTEGTGGELVIKFKRTKKYYLLKVSDNGIGIPVDINVYKPKTLGLELINILTDQLNGENIIASGSGTTILVAFPVK